jgi:asparagine synthase (glutamine-hydrolysing)
MTEVYHQIRQQLVAAVNKRCCTTERPIACLLSGGLDSSLIASIVAQFHRERGLPPIETYSIGLEGSVDLYYAKIVANHIRSKHTEILLTEADFTSAIPEVIRSIESYDTTTVRASIGNWLLGKYIAANSEAKVIFNGDGADELCGGYLYMNACPDAVEFDRESRRLLADIHAFDVLRSDKSISSHGLEPRTPFLDRTWVQFYLGLSPKLRAHPFLGKPEKYLLREAFGETDFLPLVVLWRRKEAFSDGVSAEKRSLYTILKEYAEDQMQMQTQNNETKQKREDYLDNTPKTSEQIWYRQIFEHAYPNLGNLVPYFWMPKYVAADDASARTLEIYKN